MTANCAPRESKSMLLCVTTTSNCSPLLPAPSSKLWNWSRRSHYRLIYREEIRTFSGKAYLMNDIQILSTIYGAAGVLGTAYLCVAMGSGLLAHRHHGRASGHHTGQGRHVAGGESHAAANTGNAGAHGVLNKIEHSAHMHLPHFHTHNIWPLLVDYFNPTSVAIMLSMGGMVGFLCLQIDSFPNLLSLPSAIVVGLIARKVFFRLLEKFSELATVSTAVNTEAAIGGKATVCLPISEGNIGEVFYEIGGKRYNTSARASDARAKFTRGQKVRVTDIKEGVFIVMLAADLETRESAS